MATTQQLEIIPDLSAEFDRTLSLVDLSFKSQFARKSMTQLDPMVDRDSLPTFCERVDGDIRVYLQTAGSEQSRRELRSSCEQLEICLCAWGKRIDSLVEDLPFQATASVISDISDAGGRLEEINHMLDQNGTADKVLLKKELAHFDLCMVPDLITIPTRFEYLMSHKPARLVA